ncbi:MAG TPA: glycosyltransferase family 9 protein, partial [Flavobacteriales bacterium]|nr:glycosyltransferase family 9 protein [Flavobacteriales bacterium]
MTPTPEHIILSRPDSIGDVMLTLPLAGLLKQRFPGVRITFIGRGYTAPVLRCCSHVDQVLTLEDLMAGDAVAILSDLHADALVHVFPHRTVARWAKAAGVPVRIGTSHRWWHWTTCTHRVAFSRRRSPLHEAQLNTKLLHPLGLEGVPSLAQLSERTGFSAPPHSVLPADLAPTAVRTVILHPGSQGSAVEWGLDNFAALMRRLHTLGIRTVVTGTASEAERYQPHLPWSAPLAIDAGGRLSLEQLVALIGSADGLVAASTGPLHIAAACGIRAVGLFAPRRPIHPGRWAPIGRDAHALVHDPDCATCRAGRPCDCITRIAPERVAALRAGLP